MSYFLQREDDGWDEVDEFVYNNWDRVYDLSDDEVRRYNGNRFVLPQDGMIHMDFPKGIRVVDFGMIARLCGATIPQHSVPGGFAPKPKNLLLVKLRGSKAKGPLYYDVSTGKKLRAVS